MSRTGSSGTCGTSGSLAALTVRGTNSTWPGLLAGVMLALAAGPSLAIQIADPVPPLGELGIDGVYRNGAWTSLRVRQPVQPAGFVRAWVEDVDGQWVGSPPVPVRGPGDRHSIAPLSVRPGRPGGRVRIEFLPDAALPADRPGSTAVETTELQAGAGEASSTTPLVLIVGNLPTAAAAVRLVASDDRRPEIVSLETNDHRLTGWRELDGYDAAIVCGSQVASLPPDSLAAIDGWVRRGGRLVFAAGESAPTISAGSSRAADWLPGAGPRLVPLKRFGAIEAYARAGGLAARVPAAGIEVPRFEGKEGIAGVVDAFEGTTAADLPLVIRRAHGLGTITWVGLDVDAPWCREWPGCDRLLAALLGGREEQETAAAPEDMSRRVPDLAGQLRVALDHFEAPETTTRPVPFEIIALLGILYALALYPLDWWLVSRSGRPWLSWMSLPLLAGGFTALAWSVGGFWGRDAPAEARTAEVLDIDAADGLVRCSTWAAVRSPANDRLDLSLAAGPPLALPDADAAVSWCADAGAGFGGVDAAVAHPSLAAGDYAYGSTLAELRGVPIAAASSRLFEAGWTGQSPAAVVRSTLVRDSRGLLVGTVSHHLPFPLEECWLLHAGWLYDVGRMAAGDTYDTEQGRGPRSLAAALTRRTAKWEADRTERWNTGDTDVARILEVAGLHAAAGGSSYTSLAAGRLGRLDLSPLLVVDRAILVGRAPTGSRGSTWRLELGAGQGATTASDAPPRTLAATAADDTSLVRIVIPLPTSAAGQETP